MAANKLRLLDQHLDAMQWLWRPMAYKEITPSWVFRQPDLAVRLQSMSDDELLAIMRDSRLALQLISEYLPECYELIDLCETTDKRKNGDVFIPRLQWEVPGRKWAQISAFCDAIDDVHHPIVEWCGGKGHLGRLSGVRWSRSVVTLEKSLELCVRGERLTRRVGCDQKFYAMDVLGAASEAFLNGRHVLALHACGELHRSLIRKAVKKNTPALSVAPCCYHLGGGDAYLPFTTGLALDLKRNDLRLAVTETITAKFREVKLRDQEMIWKLGFDELQRDCLNAGYREIKSIEKAWLKMSFEYFCLKLAQREDIHLPESIDWRSYEQRGARRRQLFMRYNVVRLAFRRAIELWLVLDMVVYLQQQGYGTALSVFCPSSLTPRNLLITAIK